MEADLDVDPSRRNKRESFTIHRINPPQKPIEVNLVGQRGFSPNNNFTMLLGNLSPGGDRILAAYFDHTGEQLTEFNIVDGVDYLQKSNLVTVLDKKGYAPTKFSTKKANSLPISATSPPARTRAKSGPSNITLPKNGAVKTTV